MINNKYTQMLDNIKISDEALNKAMRNVRNSSRKEQVISMKEKSGILWKTTSFAAVCLAVLLMLGGVFWISGRESSVPNTFTISANADEINSDTNVIIGELDYSGGGWGTYDDESGLDKKLCFRKQIEFPVLCEGENIESITYSVDNYKSELFEMYFITNKDYSGFISNNGTDNMADKTVYIPNTMVSTEYTVDYGSQPSSEDFGKRVDGNKADPVLLSFNFFVYSDINKPDIEDSCEFYNDVLLKMFEKTNGDLKVDVTANFTDGTSQTKTIQMFYEYDKDKPDNIQILGKISEN